MIAVHSHVFSRSAFLFALILPLLVAGAARGADRHRLQPLIAQLGSDDPNLRESALQDLMNFKGPDLPAIRQAAIAQSPLSPGQVAALREAVTQIFLAAQPYLVDPDYQGFIGIHWGLELKDASPIVVDERIPGFPAYKCLRRGDVILAFADWPNIPLRNPTDFIVVARRFMPGDSIRLAVLRHGRPIVVTITFDYFPIEAMAHEQDMGAWLDAWIQDRAQKAEDYWNREFAVIDPAVAPMATQASTSIQP
jgi:hypothetical protein